MNTVLTIAPIANDCFTVTPAQARARDEFAKRLGCRAVIAADGTLGFEGGYEGYDTTSFLALCEALDALESRNDGDTQALPFLDCLGELWVIVNARAYHPEALISWADEHAPKLAANVPWGARFVAASGGTKVPSPQIIAALAWRAQGYPA